MDSMITNQARIPVSHFFALEHTAVQVEVGSDIGL